MALTNLPYDDDAIIAAAESATVLGREVRDVQVDFASTSVSDDSVARVTATITWTVPADEAVRILDEARPRG
ncbi:MULTISPECIES: hypothetical protein [Clavibacter]|uniref:Uncharacterized protein n=3 Tax=Clavibacter TaxID=1573 RepID=A0A399NGL8_9MICO|nr:MULTISPECIES: hypothetical protein [Clavibacter]AJW78150.1 hypothetical protein VO01_02565 [Clavibacter michiganensis subsp. insidiosus]AWF99451.1 hypothetical protein BEH61_13150 [Clavibacter michiganensis subsp. insidiosus]AWG00431.1 hypothetical protein BEH62_02335 [Clavibacter michiganensis subsp. insidiosus]KDP91172.1 hypothetical protein W824_07760 [Clavibacter cf. michiganensis LMG 26808]MBF4620980.1 hypothetical protein [Clavibacter sp. VKM Ac-2542]